MAYSGSMGRIIETRRVHVNLGADGRRVRLGAQGPEASAAPAPAQRVEPLAPVEPRVFGEGGEALRGDGEAAVVEEQRGEQPLDLDRDRWVVERTGRAQVGRGGDRIYVGVRSPVQIARRGPERFDCYVL